MLILFNRLIDCNWLVLFFYSYYLFIGVNSYLLVVSLLRVREKWLDYGFDFEVLVI